MKRPKVIVGVALWILFCAVSSLWAAPLRFAYSVIAPPVAAVWMAEETGAFKRHGLDVQLVYIPSSGTNIQALLGGSIEIATPGSSGVVLAAARGAPVVAIAGMVTTVRPRAAARALLNAADLDIPFAMNVMAATRDFLQRKPDLAERALKAYVEGVAALMSEKEGALRVLARYLKRDDPRFLEEMYAIAQRFTERVPRVDPRTVATVLEFEPVKGVDAESLAPRVVDNSLVDKLAREGFIDRAFAKAR